MSIPYAEIPLLSFVPAGSGSNPKSSHAETGTGMIPVPLAPAGIALYALVNSLVFCLYGYDKHTARVGGRRIPEYTLLGAALCGPFGAYGAMLLFRHKTLKMKFYLVPVFMLIHIAGILYMAGALVSSSV